jgi:CheY-like chemotaxis protein
VAKILVADDNSNVQKTVVLALAELGAEIVSVNNGEAAVRKLSDFSPDLILADIFMPVRNGYEVCEYVKKDSRFHRVPVVLLVGAFDPLDEREAQRVGADGILKKPFVPPDPLITMVKTLLDRTLGEHLVGVTASSPAVAAQARSGGTAVAEAMPPEPDTFEESSSQEFPPPVERVEFGEGSRPVAFGTLLEAPTQDVAAGKAPEMEHVDEEQVLTNARDATLGDPVFWRNDSPESQPEPSEEPSEEESSEAASSVIEPQAWKEGEDSPPQIDEAQPLQPIEPLVLVREENNETPPSIVDPASILEDPAAQSTLSVEPNKPEDLAANPIEWMATVPQDHSDEAPEEVPGWDEPIPDATETIDRVESLEQPQISAVVPPEVPVPVQVPVLEQPDAPLANESPTPANPSPASTETPVSAPEEPDVAPSPATQRATDTVRSIPKESWADLTASLEASASEPAAPPQKLESTPATQEHAAVIDNSQAAPTSPAPESSTHPELVEAVVQRVLDKMRPQVVDIITKEFLRPIVQALVHREIEKH